MRLPTPATAGESAIAPTRTGSPRWSPSQQSELSALQSGQWWPFQRADATVLEWLHRKQSQKQKPLSDYEDALL